MNQKFCPNDGSALRAESSDDPLIGQVLADRYHVSALIGEGGMGRVYIAEHVRMGRKSALKVMSPSLAATADAITRFNREASNASRINHPNVAAIYDFGETTDGLLYIAMEFVDGETLHTLIARDGPLPMRRAATIAKGVADALGAAHHLDIVHRDLKPDNIMIARQLDGSDWVKVVDFGIAKSVAQGAASQTVTTVGVSLGTPEYMSPEQLAGEKLDHRTDIYSLGLVVFNMLTGELAYPKLTSKETLVRRLTSPPATLSDVRPDREWPAGLQAALDAALAPEAQSRYESVGDFGRALIDAVTSTEDADPDQTVRISRLGHGGNGELPRRKPTVPLPSPTATARTGPARAKRDATSKRSAMGLVGIVVALLGVAGVSYPLAHRGTAPRGGGDSITAVATDSAASRAVAAKQSLASDAGPAPAVARAPSTATAGRADSGGKRASATSPLGVSRASAPPPTAPNVDSIVSALTDSFAKAESAKIADLRRLNRRGGNGQQIATQHPWLRANGDSGSVSLPSGKGRNGGYQKAVDEIQGHMQRASVAISAGQLQKVAPELRDAQSEMTILRELLPPGAPAPVGLQQRLAGLRRQAFTACTSAAADSAGALRCRIFQPGLNLTGGRPVRGGTPPPLIP